MMKVNYYHFQIPDSPRNSESDPVIGVSDDGTFEEMRWLLGASEVPVRMIAAQFISAISYSDSGCEKLIGCGCIPPLVKRLSDPFCGLIVSSTILRLSSYSEAVSILANETMLIILLKAIKDSEVTWKETICKILVKLFSFNIPKLLECHLALIMQLLGQETRASVFESNDKSNDYQTNSNNIDIDLSLTIDAMPKSKNNYIHISPTPLLPLSTTTADNAIVGKSIPSECTYLLHALTNSLQSSPFVRQFFLTSPTYQESLLSLLYTIASLDTGHINARILPLQLEGLLGLLHNYLLVLITSNRNNNSDTIHTLNKLVLSTLASSIKILESNETSIATTEHHHQQQQQALLPPPPPPQLLTRRQSRQPYGSLTSQSIEIITSIKKIIQSLIDDESSKEYKASSVNPVEIIDSNSSSIRIANLQSYELLLLQIESLLNNIDNWTSTADSTSTSTSQIDSTSNSNTLPAKSRCSDTSNTKLPSHLMTMTSTRATGGGTAVTGNAREDSLEEFASQSNYVTSIISAAENNWIDSRADSK